MRNALKQIFRNVLAKLSKLSLWLVNWAIAFNSKHFRDFLEISQFPKTYSWLNGQFVYLAWFLLRFWLTYVWWQCAKSVQIRSLFWSVFSRIQAEYGNIRTRKTPYFVTLYAGGLFIQRTCDLTFTVLK